MHSYNFTVENSKNYLFLPISFNNTNYIVEITDTSDISDPACVSYGVAILNNNKIEVFSIGWDLKTQTIAGINKSYYKGNMMLLGF